MKSCNRSERTNKFSWWRNSIDDHHQSFSIQEKLHSHYKLSDHCRNFSQIILDSTRESDCVLSRIINSYCWGWAGLIFRAESCSEQTHKRIWNVRLKFGRGDDSRSVSTIVKLANEIRESTSDSLAERRNILHDVTFVCSTTTFVESSLEFECRWSVLCWIKAFVCVNPTIKCSSIDHRCW